MSIFAYNSIPSNPTVEVIPSVVKPTVMSDKVVIDPTEKEALTPVNGTPISDTIDPTEVVADTPVIFINSIAPVVSSPTLAVADTPVIALGPNSNPKVPTLAVAAMPLIGSVLTPKATPSVPKVTVDDCPSRLTVGLITKLKLPTLVVAS